MIITEKNLKKIIRETLAEMGAINSLDLTISAVYRKGEERGYLEKSVPLFVKPGVKNDEMYKFIDPIGRWSIYYPEEDSKNKILDLKPTIEESLDYASNDNPVIDVAEAISELSSFLELAYRNIQSSRFEPIHPNASAVHLFGCYERLVRAYINLLEENENDR
ncbi:MAG: hypothetical protein ABH824_00260 [Nanoarchaeota archaeon]|nr:hypothetical protein [Nanoarchaeota archaeon]